jgi:predicted Fe-Mo cluster-binding NifX family protein
LRIAVPTKNNKGLDGEVAEVFSRAPFFSLIDMLGSEPKDIDVIDNTASLYSHGAGPIAVKLLHDNKVDLLFAPEIGMGTSTLLEEMKIQYRRAEKNSKVSTLIEELLNS